MTLGAVAASADGRRIVFEAPLGTALVPGGFAVVATTPPLLAQVTRAELGNGRDGAGAPVLVGDALALRGGGAGFGDTAIEPAPVDEIAAWAREELSAEGLDVGELAHGSHVRALLDPRGLARHTFLVGQSGSGKTYTTGVFLEQIIRQTKLRIIVLDPNSDHVGLRATRSGVDEAVAGAYRDRASRLQVARATSDLPFATAPIGMHFSNFPPSAQRLVLRLDPLQDTGEVEALLDITERLATPYTPDDVARAALELDTEPGRELAVRIRSLGLDGWSMWKTDPGQPVLGELVAEHPDTGDHDGLVIDLGSLAEPAERSAVAAAVLLTVWADRAARIPTLVVLDEAHHICPAEPADPIQAVATETAILIAGEGRKYGIFLFVATQRPQKIHPSVVAGCENIALLRMNSLRDVAELEASFSHVPQGLLRLAPGFSRGEALLAGPVVPAPLHTRIGGRITEEGGGDIPSTWASLA